VGNSRAAKTEYEHREIRNRKESLNFIRRVVHEKVFSKVIFEEHNRVNYFAVYCPTFRFV
jgi:hypothetical protein